MSETIQFILYIIGYFGIGYLLSFIFLYFGDPLVSDHVYDYNFTIILTSLLLWPLKLTIIPLVKIFYKFHIKIWKQIEQKQKNRNKKNAMQIR